MMIVALFLRGGRKGLQNQLWARGWWGTKGTIRMSSCEYCQSPPLLQQQDSLLRASTSLLSSSHTPKSFGECRVNEPPPSYDRHPLILASTVLGPEALTPFSWKPWYRLGFRPLSQEGQTGPHF